MEPDRRLDDIAAHQYGVFSIDQARSAGLTPRMMDNRIEHGAWVRLAPSVYALASSPPKWERQMAAALLTRPGSLAAGSSAAYLHEFEGAKAGRPVILTGSNGNARSALAKVVRSRSFDDIERTRVRGFPVTSIPETLVTIANQTPTDRLEQIVDSLLAARRVRVPSIQQCINNRSGRPGIVRLRGIIDERSEDAYQPPMSVLEAMLIKLLAEPGIPDHVRQRPFAFEHARMVTDAYIPVWRLIVEADGRRWHQRKADMERDRQRDNMAAANGYAVLRFTWRMLTDDWDLCLRHLRQTGAARSPR